MTAPVLFTFPFGRTAQRAVATLLAAALAGAASAQLGEGWIVFGRAFDPVTLVAMPRGGSTMPIPIQNLPVELTQTAPWNGVNALAIHPDGSLVVGNVGSGPNAEIVVYVLQLSGLSVTGSERYSLGQAAGFGGVTAVDIAPDGRIYFVVDSLQGGGPLGMARFGNIDRATGTITPLNVIGAGGVFNALALNRDGTEAYIAGGITTGSILYRVPLTLPVLQPFALTSVTTAISGLDLDDAGRLVIGRLNLASGGLATFDPATNVVTPVFGSPGNAFAVAVEHATGELVFTTVNSNFGYEVQRRDGSGGYATLYSGGGQGGYTAIAVLDSPRAYGAGTPGASVYAWQVAPSATGVPTIGNSAFALESTSTPPAVTVSVAAFNTARANLPVLGVNLLVDPAGALLVAYVSGASVSFPLAIPNDPSLAGSVFHGQSLHLEAGGWAASHGLTFGVVVP